MQECCFIFLRYFMDGKGVYTLRSLPMGASGLLWSMFISMPSAMILLWAAQLLAIYLGYGLYRMEVLLYNLPGNVDGMSRIGFSIIVPDREWLPPANDLYLAFIRTPFLQLFYPRHPVFWRLRRSWWFCRLFQGLIRCLPCVSGGRGRCCRFYFAGALFSSGWWKGGRMRNPPMSIQPCGGAILSTWKTARSSSSFRIVPPLPGWV